MSIFTVVPTSTTPNSQQHAGSRAESYRSAGHSRRSSNLDLQRASDMSCNCIEHVDLSIFRGVFTEQWLHGRVYDSSEALFFCTSCGPVAVQDPKKGPQKNKKKTTFARIKSFFSSSSTSTKKLDSSLSTGGAGAVPAIHNNSSSGNHNHARTHSNRISADEEELPLTPRTEKELFLCATCGLCFCRPHASDHSYSRRSFTSITNGKGGGGGSDEAAGTEEVTPHGYPYHSFFISVPSYISTHPQHHLPQTEWGLLFPTVVIRDVEHFKMDLTKQYPFYSDFEAISDEALFTVTSSGSCSLPSNRVSATQLADLRDGNSPGPHWTNNNNNSTRGGGVVPLPDITTPSDDQTSRADSRNPQQQQQYQNHTRNHSLSTPLSTASGGGGGFLKKVSGGTSALDKLPKPEYFSLPEDQWSYVVWCAKCSDRATKLSGKGFDVLTPWHRQMRRLGHLLALLSYFAHRGVQLSLSDSYNDYKYKKHMMQVQQQQQQRQSMNVADAQRVAKTSELPSLGNSSTTAVGSLIAKNNSYTNNNASISSQNRYGVDISRIDIDKIMSKSALCSCANQNLYMCYMNSVLQCVLRCRLFVTPLLFMDPSTSPGKLTTSLNYLLRQLAHQTYQDVRNSAAHAFVRNVYRSICALSPMFEEEEQQDAQELLLCLVNGVADEFDKGKTEAQKESTPRISFEGRLRTEVVCSACQHKVPREEMFMALSIPIGTTIDDGIKSLFQPAHLTGKDRYACENCFKKLSADEQAAHNARAKEQQEERKRINTLGKKAAAAANTALKNTESVYENCVYADAEVKIQMTRLGGTLAVHLLRFHYDAEAQDFIKVTSHVGIPLEIDLTSYVSPAVRAQYAQWAAWSRLQRQFPHVSQAVLEKYVADSNNDCVLAAKKLISDGQGVDERAQCFESSVAGGDSHTTDATRRHANDSEPSVVPSSARTHDSAASDYSANNGTQVFHSAMANHRDVNGPLGNVSSASFATAASAAVAVSAENGKEVTSSSNHKGTPPAAAAATSGLHAGGSTTSLTTLGKSTTRVPPVADLLSADYDPFPTHAVAPSLVRRLVGIVTHKGSLHGGHYIAYVRHLAQPAVWFRCDDEDVTIVEERTVLESSSEVYLAFYE